MRNAFSLFARSNRTLGVDILDKEKGYALVLGVSEKNKSRLADAQVLIPEGDAQPFQDLFRRVKDMSGLRVPVVSNLSFRDYQLLQITPPQVREGEMKMAVRWQIKDLINLPLEQTVIDYFPAPPVPGQGEMIYVVAADMKAVQSQVDFLKRARLKIRAIDIPELALRNIVLRDRAVDGNLALLYMEKNRGFILIFKNGDLCLSRKVHAGLANLLQVDNQYTDSDILEKENTAASTLESILLDLQRTFDYFESNFRSNPVATLLLAPQIGDVPELQDYLQQNLDLSVRLMDIRGFIGESFSYREQGKYLFALGNSLKAG